MQLEDLKAEYDKLQIKYGAKELTSIYNGGCTNNPDFCFVFMNIYSAESHRFFTCAANFHPFTMQI